MALVRQDSRVSFAIDWYDDEAEAEAAAKVAEERCDTYNGGYFHGMSCGREKRFDYTEKDGRKLYAVTVR